MIRTRAEVALSTVELADTPVPPVATMPQAMLVSRVMSMYAVVVLGDDASRHRRFAEVAAWALGLRLSAKVHPTIAATAMRRICSICRYLTNLTESGIGLLAETLTLSLVVESRGLRKRASAGHFGEGEQREQYRKRLGESFKGVEK